MKRKIKTEFPEDYGQRLENSGLYPDIDDPQFVSRLLKKSEFADTVSTFDPKESPCETGPDFEVTPVQRFVANFLHPRTPYKSALLYHGVGVGKTCAAIQSAEAYLDIYPRRKVFIVCPRAIRSGFYRTIFDIERVQLGKGDAPNTANGCTGSTYLKLANCLEERDLSVISQRVKRVIDRRYSFFGYLEFRNYIRNVLKSVQKGEKEAELRAEALQEEFNYRFLIIDEAHNLRDVTGSAVDAGGDDLDAEAEKEDSKGGKELTPFLKELVSSTEGIKLLLMTATPMFNTVFEIHFLLNLMLMNDKKPEIQMAQILNPDGSLAEGADRVLKPIANAYVSFMRGENPNSFPLRLYPSGMNPDGSPVNRLTPQNYPEIQLSRTLDISVSDELRESVSKLPIVLSHGQEGSDFNTLLRTFILSSVKQSGTGYQVLDSLLQAGNCIFPSPEGNYDYNDPSKYTGKSGFDGAFTKGSKGTVKARDAKWLLLDSFQNYSPKGAIILRSCKHAEGVQFVYSRFVTTGALLLALALEVNGYTPYGREPLLSNGIQDGLGKQCALCSLREKEHKGMEHPFVPAKYALLTGDSILSPNNADLITVARGIENKNGEKIKIVLGSQIASEGVDLRFIREIHILDSWFHLNKTEQIIGRGIRYCSHSSLEPEKRNTTIFLHAIELLGEPSIETADLYCYRLALQKAQQVGEMSRRLKVYAVDCNLRKNVTLLKGIGQRKQIDSQGQPRNAADGNVSAEGDGVRLDDMDFTAICDWMECEPITCSPDVNVNLSISDDSTYDSFSARFKEASIQKAIKAIFAETAFQRQEDLIQILLMQGIPRSAVDITLQGIINNRLFRVTSGGQEGYITYKNKYFLFQPDAYKDLKIPLALRIASFPIKRDEFSPQPMVAVPYEKPLINTEKPAIPLKEQISVEDFWSTLESWTQKVISGEQTKVGIDIERKLELFSEDSRVQKSAFMDKLEAIVFLNKRIPEKEAFKQSIMEYFWDEWIHPKLQVQLLLKKDYVEGKEQRIESGTIKAIRYVNADTDTLEYMCENGEPCSRAIVDAFNRMKDPIKERSAQIGKAGKLYGFCVPKRGNFVFKTQEPHPIGKKPDRGKECGIITTKNQYIEKLVSLGEELKRLGLPNLNLTEANLLDSAVVINNTTRGCVVLELILRYFDKLRIGDKRWFFRPIAAYMSGHRGLVNPVMKKAAETAPPKSKVKLVREEPAPPKPKMKLVREAQKPKEPEPPQAPEPQAAPPKTKMKLVREAQKPKEPEPPKTKMKLVREVPKEEPKVAPEPEIAPEPQAAPPKTKMKLVREVPKEEPKVAPEPQAAPPKTKMKLVRTKAPEIVKALEPIPFESAEPPKEPTPPPTPPPKEPTPPPKVPTPPPAQPPIPPPAPEAVVPKPKPKATPIPKGRPQPKKVVRQINENVV